MHGKGGTHTSWGATTSPVGQRFGRDVVYAVLTSVYAEYNIFTMPHASHCSYTFPSHCLCRRARPFEAPPRRALSALALNIDALVVLPRQHLARAPWSTGLYASFQCHPKARGDRYALGEGDDRRPAVRRFRVRPHGSPSYVRGAGRCRHGN